MRRARAAAIAADVCVHVGVCDVSVCVSMCMSVQNRPSSVNVRVSNVFAFIAMYTDTNTHHLVFSPIPTHNKHYKQRHYFLPLTLSVQTLGEHVPVLVN